MLDDLEIKMKNVKREIIEIIDRAFVDSERVIRDEFLKMSKQ